MNAERLTRINPFKPEQPASPIYFAGRTKEIHTAVRCISQTYHGNSKNMLILGERGIGKTSLAFWVKYIAEKHETPNPLNLDFNFLVSFNQLKAKMTQNDVIQMLANDLKNLTLKTGLGRAREFFDSEIKSLSIGNLFSLERKEKPINLDLDFAHYLEGIWDRIRDQYHGIIIILDEFEQLAGLEGFASFWKSLYEKLVIDGYQRIMFVFVGLSRKLDPFFEDHPSVVRLFDHVEVSLMTPEESAEVIQKALAQTKPVVTIDPRAQDAIIHFSGGYPQFIQELGHAAFEMDQDNHLSHEDFIRGIFGDKSHEGAIKQLGRKLFDKMYLQDIGSDTYRRILSAIAKNEKETITRNEISAKSGIPQKTVGTYLRNMIARSILVKEGRGQYRLVNRLFGVYIALYEKNLENSKKLPLLEKE